MKQIGFIAGSDGAVVKYDPNVHGVAHPKHSSDPLTKHQKATVYFKALRMANSLLHEIGFQTVADCGHSGFSVEMSGFILEMMVKESPRVAYVTSYPGYKYNPDKVTAKVVGMRPLENNDYVIQAVASFPGGTVAPTFIVIGPNSQDVLKEAFLNILMTAQEFISRDKSLMDRIKTAMARRDLNREYERLQAYDAVSDSRACPGPGVHRSIEGPCDGPVS